MSATIGPNALAEAVHSGPPLAAERQRWVGGPMISRAYESLVKTGFVGSLKRDVLLEASADLMYVDAIHQEFAEAGAAAAADAVACTVALITELTAKGLCALATWSNGYGGERTSLDATQEDLIAIVSEPVSEENVFRYFLVASDAGREWVARYEALEAEL